MAQNSQSVIKYKVTLPLKLETLQECKKIYLKSESKRQIIAATLKISVRKLYGRKTLSIKSVNPCEAKNNSRVRAPTRAVNEDDTKPDAVSYLAEIF